MLIPSKSHEAEAFPRSVEDRLCWAGWDISMGWRSGSMESSLVSSDQSSPTIQDPFSWLLPSSAIVVLPV